MKYTHRGAFAYFDSEQRLIGVPSGEWRGGTKGLDIYVVLEPGYGDYALEAFILSILDMCYTKKGSDSGETAIQKYTGKKSHNVAIKEFKTLTFSWEKDIGYLFIPSKVSREYRGAFEPLWDKRITIPLTYEKGALAQAFRKAMEISSQDDYQPACIAPERQTFQLFYDDEVPHEVSYIEPQDDHIINAEDYNVAEIHQGYSYSEDYSKEPVAELFFSMAAELNCDMSPDNIRSRWEHYHGKAETFNVTEVDSSSIIGTDPPIFTHRAEFRNQRTHKISYLIRLDEYEIFACELEVRLKHVDGALHFKLIKLFGELVRSVSLS